MVWIPVAAHAEGCEGQSLQLAPDRSKEPGLAGFPCGRQVACGIVLKHHAWRGVRDEIGGEEVHSVWSIDAAEVF